MIDLFGSWNPLEKLAVGDAANAILPDIWIKEVDVLEMFSLDERSRIPFWVLDRLRDSPGLDIHLNGPVTHGQHLQDSPPDANRCVIDATQLIGANSERKHE